MINVATLYRAAHNALRQARSERRAGLACAARGGYPTTEERVRECLSRVASYRAQIARTRTRTRTAT